MASVPSLYEGERLVRLLRTFPTMNQVVGMAFEKAEANRLLAQANSRADGVNNFILLTGVSGTGKSFLGAAIVKKLVLDKAAACFCLSFNLELCLKLRDDSFKFIDDVFDEMIKRRPSVLYFKYLDLAVPKAMNGPSGRLQDLKINMASRCIKHLLRLQFEKDIYVIGVTAGPFDMHPVALKLFQHGVIYCRIPSGFDRCHLLRVLLTRYFGHTLTGEQLMSIGLNPAANMFSRRDVSNLVNELRQMVYLCPRRHRSIEHQETCRGNAVQRKLLEMLTRRTGNIIASQESKLLRCLKTEFPDWWKRSQPGFLLS